MSSIVTIKGIGRWFIYHLLDPRDESIRYVGWTTTSIKDRLKRHVQDARRGEKNIYRVNWIKSLLSLNLVPRIVEISKGFGPSWCCAEKMEIALQRDLGANLTNLTDGGEGTPGMVHSPETIAKMTGRKKSSEEIAKLRAANLGKKRSPESIAKTRAGNLGKKHSPETKVKIGAAGIGRKKSPKTIAKLRAANIGKKHGPERIEKMRIARWGKKHSPETKAKISQPMKSKHRDNKRNIDVGATGWDRWGAV